MSATKMPQGRRLTERLLRMEVLKNKERKKS